MVTLHETEVDGVRCFWVETGRPTLAAWLVFRAGIVDESITELGFLHLLEHLSLNGRGSGPLEYNGQVALTQSVFSAHGPQALVVAHLAAVTTWLAEPRFDDLDRERRVLQAEAATRGGAVASRAMGWRYGAVGPGLAVYDEVGLGRSTPERLAGRAALAYTRGNAVLVLDGPPPPDLRLHLPEGPLRPLKEAVPCEKHYPALYVDESGLVISGVVPRSIGSSMACDLLQRELADRLRHQDGNAYAPWATYERVDESSAVIVAGSDVQPAALPTLVGDVRAMMRHLRTYRLAEDRLDELKSSRIQGLMDPYAQVGIAIRAANEFLSGRPSLTLDEMVTEVQAVTTSQVLDTFQAMQNTLLLGVPGASVLRDPIRRLEAPTNPPSVKGRSWRSANWPADKSRLRVGTDAVEIVDGDVARTIRSDDVHALFAYDNGLRHVLTADGYGLTVNPHAWRAGASAIERIDRLVTQDRILPLPAVDGIEQGARLGWWRRWSAFLVSLVARPAVVGAVLISLLVVIWVGGFAVIVTRTDGSAAAVWGFLGGCAVFGAIRGFLDDE